MLGILWVVLIDVLWKMIMSGGLGGGGGLGGVLLGLATSTTAAAFSAFASGVNLDVFGVVVVME